MLGFLLYPNMTYPGYILAQNSATIVSIHGEEGCATITGIHTDIVLCKNTYSMTATTSWKVKDRDREHDNTKFAICDQKGFIMNSKLQLHPSTCLNVCRYFGRKSKHGFYEILNLFRFLLRYFYFVLCQFYNIATANENNKHSKFVI